MAPGRGKEYAVSVTRNKGTSIRLFESNNPGVATRIWLASIAVKDFPFSCAGAQSTANNKKNRMKELFIYSKYWIVPPVAEAYFFNSSKVISAASFRPSEPL